MNSTEFHIAPEDVIATLRDLCRLQGDSDLASLLDDASGEIVESGYDNWGGGTTFYTLALEIPLEVFARVEPKIAEIEASLASKVRSVGKNFAGQALTEVSRHE